MTIPPVVGLSDTEPAETRYRPDAGKILSGDPEQSVRNHYASADGRFNVGVWEGKPGTWRVAFTETEFCHLLSGKVVVTADDGTARTFTAGDAFVMPSGFTGTWEVVETARKLYAVYE
ncbi:MAG TPA: cupin domain-containing protein [Azospirillaceae bacterium]|nr:cupin domain-containing protein [Azospirillaceae bacterium]